MLEVHLDADTVILLGEEWMSKDDYDFLSRDPILLIERFEENLEEFIEAIGGIRAIVKSISWRE